MGNIVISKSAKVRQSLLLVVVRDLPTFVALINIGLFSIFEVPVPPRNAKISSH